MSLADGRAQREIEIDTAYDAFEAYAKAKRTADATLTFAACHDAAQAWVQFVNLYLPADQRLDDPEADFRRLLSKTEAA